MTKRVTKFEFKLKILTYVLSNTASVTSLCHHRPIESKSSPQSYNLQARLLPALLGTTRPARSTE